MNMRQKLIEAIASDDTGAIRDLLASGVDPAAESQLGAGDSAVHAAGNQGKLECLELLVDAWQRAEPEALAECDILWHVLFCGQVAAGRWLADRGAPAPFAMCVALGRVEEAQRELDEKGRLRSDDGSWMSDDEQRRTFNCAFLYSAICGTVRGMEFVAAGIDGVDMQPPGSDFGGVAATAMHWAAAHDRASAVEWLLDRGADPTIRDDAWNATAVGWALHGGHRSVLEVFRRHADRLDRADRESL